MPKYNWRYQLKWAEERRRKAAEVASATATATPPAPAVDPEQRITLTGLGWVVAESLR